MFWDTTIEIMLLILGILLTIVPILRELLKNKWNRKKYIDFLVICGAVFLGLGTIKIIRDKSEKRQEGREKIALEKRINFLDSSMNLLLDANRIAFAARKNDSIRDSEFQYWLLKDYKILKDSTTNKPVQISSHDTYNAYIKQLENLYMGPQYRK